ncbi:MAG: hypothetical protein COT71_00940 [Candidatus Andersenbacteria bacterium CG10_big_fil_rev_8_21_14_0_10_54_11]|uniref:Uncharacterized protein n=1 Tax=Candidatus Andersenbacteria bacterium CG10_big_fil_rev_8_21_14_0_10_54_11 TaxID=1974485 RepID=A0A2M6X029_9BACT|nr:MAG: hypothetical protein COT71_00940 [Candidatus Andersenbacteria bacterium CG10_big_fil_rev_8_21_14_0_10_54_11]
MPKQSAAPVTKQDFEEAMHILAKSFERVATKEDLKNIETRLNGVDGRLDSVDKRLDGIDQRLDKIERVQHSMLKVLDSIEGRLKEMANHEERITRLEATI